MRRSQPSPDAMSPVTSTVTPSGRSSAPSLPISVKVAGCRPLSAQRPWRRTVRRRRTRYIRRPSPGRRCDRHPRRRRRTGCRRGRSPRGSPRSVKPWSLGRRRVEAQSMCTIVLGNVPAAHAGAWRRCDGVDPRTMAGAMAAPKFAPAGPRESQYYSSPDVVPDAVEPGPSRDGRRAPARRPPARRPGARPGFRPVARPPQGRARPRHLAVEPRGRDPRLPRRSRCGGRRCSAGRQWSTTSTSRSRCGASTTSTRRLTSWRAVPSSSRASAT